MIRRALSLLNHWKGPAAARHGYPWQSRCPAVTVQSFVRHVTVSARGGPGIIHWPPPPDLEPGLGLRSLSLEEVTFSNEQLEL